MGYIRLHAHIKFWSYFTHKTYVFFHNFIKFTFDGLHTVFGSLWSKFVDISTRHSVTIAEVYIVYINL